MKLFQNPHSIRTNGLWKYFDEEKLIGELTDHRSDALSRYEKISEGNKAKVSYLLGPNVVYTPCKSESCKQDHGKPINGDVNVSNASFYLKISKIVIFYVFSYFTKDNNQ